MPKYEVITTIWSVSQNKYIYPGEVVEFTEDETAILLMKKNVIKPAEVKREKIIKVKIEEPEVMEDGTND